MWSSKASRPGAAETDRAADAIYRRRTDSGCCFSSKRQWCCRSWLAVPLVEIQWPTVACGGVGSGDPLVLVHGSWDDRRVWALIEDDLARRFRVVSYDRRGHTSSEDSAEPGTRRDDEDDLASLIEALGMAPANVVGNSFGARSRSAWQLAGPSFFRTLGAHEPPLISLAADDPVVAEVGEAIGPVLALIERGEAEAARNFVERIALGPGAWEMMPEEERASLAANAQTFAGEVLDPAWAEIDLDALGDITVSGPLDARGSEPSVLLQDHRAAGGSHRWRGGKDPARCWARSA